VQVLDPYEALGWLKKKKERAQQIELMGHMVFLELTFDGYASRSLTASSLVTATRVSVEIKSPNRRSALM